MCCVRNGSSVSTAVNEVRGYRCRCTFLERGETERAYLRRCTSFPFYDAACHRRQSKFFRESTRFFSNVEPIETRYRRLCKWARTTMACMLERERERERESELLWCAKRLCLTGHVGQRWTPHQIFFLFLLDQRAQGPLVPFTYRSSLAHATGDC